MSSSSIVFADVRFIVLLILPLFTEKSPSEEPPATSEKQEETEECDYEGKPLILLSKLNNESEKFIDFDFHTYRNRFAA